MTGEHILGERVAALEARIREQADMLRQVTGLLRNQATLAARVDNAREDIRELAARVEQLDRDFTTALEGERRERQAGQEARLKENKSNRTLIVVAAIGLCGTFISSLAVVLSVVLL